MPISRGTTQVAVKRKLASPVKEATTTKRQRKAFCNLTNYAAAARLKEKHEQSKQKRASDGAGTESEESLYVSALECLPSDNSIQSNSSTSSMPQATKPRTRLSVKLTAQAAKPDENARPRAAARASSRAAGAPAHPVAKVITRPATKIATIKPMARRAIKPARTDESSAPVKKDTRTSTKAATVTSDGQVEARAAAAAMATSTDSQSDSKTPDHVGKVPDFDKACLKDVHQVGEYAQDIFSYMKQREPIFRVQPYLEQHPGLTRRHRAQLVDILVQLQEHLELTHETLYLAVYLLDNYLAATHTNMSASARLLTDGMACTLELVRTHLHSLEEFKRHWRQWRLSAIAAMLLACKYEERCAPHLDEFVYCVSDTVSDAVRARLIRAESAVWRAARYELGVPLSYRFLRRYARCVYTAMDTLTLARYVLELSLLDYDVTVGLGLSVSRLAAAALWLARRMHFAHKQKDHEQVWSPPLRFYSGYEEDHLKEIIYKLNDLLYGQKDLLLTDEDDDDLATIKNKYSHKVFYRVAEIPLIPNEQLLRS